MASKSHSDPSLNHTTNHQCNIGFSCSINYFKGSKNP
uniref:Uncharacterized protein n=1 Tax=Arundo donax TaxID=35708 RepID=A0A0A9FP34_ARUDO